LNSLRDASIDTVFADPPFNIRKDYGRGKDKDNLAGDEYLEWCYSWIDESLRVLKPGGSIFVYNLPQWAYHLAAHLESKGMNFRHWIAVSMKGTFPRGKKLYPAHYALLYFTKGTPTTFDRDAVRQPVPVCRHCGKDVKDYGGHRKFLNPLGLNLTDIWDDTAPARHTQFKARWGINELKPLIPMRCIQISTRQGDIVLDPFGGGGSTFEAAERLHRLWIGSEIVDCELIRERFKRNLPDSKEAVPRELAAAFKRPNEELIIDMQECPKSPAKRLSTERNKLSNGSDSTNSSTKSVTL
jgi:site-specific DNA-methyltransferase (adenine-specific)